MESPPDTTEQSSGIDRRSVLRRGAILGGALAWTVPAVQTIAGPAFAAGTPCLGSFIYNDGKGHCFRVTYHQTKTCCDCVATFTPVFGNPVGAAGYCQVILGACELDPANSGPVAC